MRKTGEFEKRGPHEFLVLLLQFFLQFEMSPKRKLKKKGKKEQGRKGWGSFSHLPVGTYGCTCRGVAPG